MQPDDVRVVPEIPRSFLNKMLRREVRLMLEAAPPRTHAAHMPTHPITGDAAATSGRSNGIPQPRTHEHASPTRLSLGTKLGYAVGNVGLQMLIAAMSFLLMIFYTDVALVPPAVAGAALLVGKVWDTINDPLFGWMTDRTRSRHGRHRVYLIYGAIPLVGWRRPPCGWCRQASRPWPRLCGSPSPTPCSTP